MKYPPARFAVGPIISAFPSMRSRRTQLSNPILTFPGPPKERICELLPLDAICPSSINTLFEIGRPNARLTNIFLADLSDFN